MKACATIYPIEYKTVRGSGSPGTRGSKGTVEAVETEGRNMLVTINFWIKLVAWGNFSGQKCPNTTTVSGASGQHMRYCKRLAQNFRQGYGGRGTLLGRQEVGLSSKIDARLGFIFIYFMLDRKKISAIKASGSRRGLQGLTPQL